MTEGREPDRRLLGEGPQAAARQMALMFALGLWITREPARAHGGDAFYAPADPGSRFTVTLPAG
ncbi:HAMP domain-containing histidine kinase [Planomonospora parontospora]|uniref:HAMP domain-containing histidine kinase n=1 Tax=Planomonospora parontospora TaxID=58119 RepID=UPI0016703AF4|nr:HAMP domain-containing histidine kinase [Planomonospora parontospora]GGL14103.1 hypothetical protein GCM10014719_15100 [Planomonospora parontospora subsp. antibiotica]GII17874.1 hypothetical protein Ppa05_46000 [Planomonospora parontospora subsp. antibiotica]